MNHFVTLYYSNSSSVISNVGGTVSVTPMESAKTFVNGNLICTSTVLNHVRTEGSRKHIYWRI